MLTCQLTLVFNTPLTAQVYEMQLSGDLPEIAPGQFVSLALPGFYLRRPISVCDAHERTLTLLYKTLGRGTEAMTRLQPGTVLDTLAGLGHGFDLSLAGERPALVGGGVGIPPLYMTARHLLARGITPVAVLGYASRREMFYAERFSALGCEVIVATDDGSFGVQGPVTKALPAHYSYVYACGPTAMLRALDASIRSDAQYSLEERMGCGFGACMGCTHQMASGPMRICREGPVFRREEILWD